MSDQTMDKVNLSLDDIIKLNKKERKQQTRGRGRGGTQGYAVGRGQAFRGQRNGRNARGRGGVSILNRHKTGTVSAAVAVRGMASSRRGQRGGLRGSSRGQGGAQRGMVRGSLRGQRGARGLLRGQRGVARGSLRGGTTTTRGQTSGTRGLRTRGIRGNVRGTRGNLRGSLRGVGGLTSQSRIQATAAAAAAGQGQAGRTTLKQKRQLAVKALLLAQKTIAQCDRQTARQNLVNTRRGIFTQGHELTTRNQGMYSSNMSVASTKPRLSLTPGRQLDGTKVTTFSPPRRQPATRGRRSWRPKTQQTNIHTSASTLTISFPNADSVSPVASFAAPAVNPQGPSQRRLKRRPWQRQNNNNNNNINNSNNSSVADLSDISVGATPGFAQQIANIKPSVPTQYNFQAKAFSTGNTSCSLNDRFSEQSVSVETLAGRKVFF